MVFGKCSLVCVFLCIFFFFVQVCITVSTCVGLGNVEENLVYKERVIEINF